MPKPGRPLGLSFAILISVMLFSLLPFAQVIFVLSLQQQFQAIEFLPGSGAIGGDLQIADANLIIPLVNGLLFLIVAIMAWRGRPEYARLAFMAGVIYITVVTLLLTIFTITVEPTVEQGFDSGAQITNSLLGARVVISVLVALYVLWYVNRGPARAFFRGYYLPEPGGETSPQTVNQ